VQSLVEPSGEVGLVADNLLNSTFCADAATTSATRASVRTRTIGFEESAEDKAAFRREREHDGAGSRTSKGMHHDTYSSLFWEYHEAEIKYLVGMREWLGKLQNQIA
jgi:hypothetical protein